VTAELQLGLGREVNHKRFDRLMREEGLQGVTRQRLRGCTRSRAADLRSDDLVHLQFRPDGPDRLWVPDVTQHHTSEGWVYLAVVIDVWSRRVVGWSIDQRPTTAMVNRALGMAVAARRTATCTTLHSDHGPQYTAWAFSQKIRAEGLVHSLGTVGDAFDNAMVKAFWGRMQTELLNRQKWSTRLELSTAMFDWIEAFYNPTRRHSSLGNISPIEFERRH
jgi:putative transposase